MKILTMNESNRDLIVEFVKNNIKISGFTYGNLADDNALVRYVEIGGSIVAMYIITREKYITYTIPANTDVDVIDMLMKDSYNYHFVEGTIIGQELSYVGNYYDFNRTNYINEVATIYENESIKSINARYLRKDEVKKYANAINTIEEFPRRSVEAIKSSMIGSKVAVVEIDGEIVSGATLTAISELGGVIVSVFTVESQRRKGYALDCINLLLDDYNQRTISLFFSNPAAKKLYTDRGFEVVDKLYMFNRRKWYLD